MIVQNVLVQDVAGSATAAGFKASATLSLEKVKRLHGTCALHVPVPLPLLVVSSVFLAELLSVGTAEDRPNMGPHVSRVCMSRKISMCIFSSKG